VQQRNPTLTALETFRLLIVLKAHSSVSSHLSTYNSTSLDPTTHFIPRTISSSLKLRFLTYKPLPFCINIMESLKDNLNWHPKARTPLNILIIGAGITGLTSALALSLTGHRVTIYEAANSLTEIGAGLQIAPNASRVLARLGILGDVMKKANVLEGLSLRRWKDDSEIGTAPLMPGVSLPYHFSISNIGFGWR
jgi:hypothetical protein